MDPPRIPQTRKSCYARLACSDVCSGRDLEQTWPTSGKFLVWPAHVISVWFPVTSEDQVSLWVVTIAAGRRLTGHRFGCGHAACEGSWGLARGRKAQAFIGLNRRVKACALSPLRDGLGVVGRAVRT
jgi:hypothetical protein